MRRQPSRSRVPTLYSHPEGLETDHHSPLSVDVPVSTRLPRQRSNPIATVEPYPTRMKYRSTKTSPAGLVPQLATPRSAQGAGGSADYFGYAPSPYLRFRQKFRPDVAADMLGGSSAITQSSSGPKREIGDDDNDSSDSDDERPKGPSRSSTSAAPPVAPQNGATESTSKTVALAISGSDARLSSPAWTRTKFGEALDGIDLDSLTVEERQRLEWQAMLASVLAGEVFTAEKTRIVTILDKVEAKTQVRDQWLGIRAWLRGRRYADELTRLTDQRNRVIPKICSEILSFRVTSIDPTSDVAELSEIEQVDALLERYDVACSLYQTLAKMENDKPEVITPAVLERVRALTSFSQIHAQFSRQKHRLALMTGNDTLDVEAPMTPDRLGLVGEVAEKAEQTNFVERVLKEDSLRKAFEKSALEDIHSLIGTARDVCLEFGDIFREIDLPPLETILMPLISFPLKVIAVALQIRLDSAHGVKDPNLIVLDTMSEDFKVTVALACTVKREYEQLTEEIPGKWQFSPFIPENYDRVILNSMKYFFKLLNWRLKIGAKGLYSKETDVLEDEEEIFREVSSTIDGGANVIAESLCTETRRLIGRLERFYTDQIRNTLSPPPSLNPLQHLSTASAGRPRIDPTTDQPLEKHETVIKWLASFLESVRQRYRKIQRYARNIEQRFANSAEYSLSNFPLSPFIAQLIRSGHFLVHTGAYEEQSQYVVASSGLRNRPYLVRDILSKAYSIAHSHASGTSASSDAGSDADEDEDEEGVCYVLIISPVDPFLWNGLMEQWSVPFRDIDLAPQRVRLVADGSGSRLSAAKKLLTAVVTEPLPADTELLSNFVDDDGNPTMTTDTTIHPTATITLKQFKCEVEQLAHLPRVNWELTKISSGTSRLAQTIVDSLQELHAALPRRREYLELRQNWFNFASDHGKHAQKYIDRKAWPDFSGKLTNLAILWLTFICDDCDPTDRKTFRWAVMALEFAMARTIGTNIFELTDNEFFTLRRKVAACMTVLISHFDILGARSSMEADKEAQQAARSLRAQTGKRSLSPVAEISQEDEDTRFRWAGALERLEEMEHARMEAATTRHVVGRVVDEEKLQDKSLLLLASSQSNVSIRWQQGRFVGAGAFGSVYQAVNLDTGQIMAAKEIKFQDVNSLSNLLSAIKEELKVTMYLQHPHIVEYYGIEVHRDKIFIFEEFCQGGTLSQLLEHGRIEDETILQLYTMQMLNGLSYLHSKKVVHRDIKPDNILLDHLGLLKIADFGAAKIITQGHAKTRIGSTRALGGAPGERGNSLTGTPMYMSPEVIKNDKRGWSGAMDIWSLGCVVLECATGRKPWSSNYDNEWAIMFQIGQGDRIPQLPEPWQLDPLGISFLRQCFTLDPQRRPTADMLLRHPWMESLNERLTEEPLEEEDEDEASAPVARHVQRLEEMEMNDIMSSPPDELEAPL